MPKFALSLLLTTLLASMSFAQTTHSSRDTSRFLGFYSATAGPYFTPGVSRMNENVTEGWKTDPAFAYTFGGLIALDFSELIGIQFGIGYDARGLLMSTNNDSATADIGVQYISIQPSLRIFWLIVGLAFQLPQSGAITASINNFNGQAHYEENRNIENADINGGTELHAGLTIPVYKSESGELHILVSGSIPFSQVLKSTTSLDSVGGANPKPNLNRVFSDVGRGPLPTLQAGISYQFDLTQLK